MFLVSGFRGFNPFMGTITLGILDTNQPLLVKHTLLVVFVVEKDNLFAIATVWVQKLSSLTICTCIYIYIYIVCAYLEENCICMIITLC